MNLHNFILPSQISRPRMLRQFQGAMLGCIWLAGCSNENGTERPVVLLPEAAVCQYILDLDVGVSADRLNRHGCDYVDTDGKTQRWPGTDNLSTTGTTSGTSAGATTGNTSSGTTSGTTSAGTTTSGTTASGETDGGTDGTGTTVGDGTPVLFDPPPAIPATLADTATGATLYQTVPNSELLNGPVVGSAAVQNTDLRKSIAFELLQQHDSLEIEYAVVTQGQTAKTSRVIFFVRNNASVTLCAVLANNIHVYSETGMRLRTGSRFDHGVADGTTQLLARSNSFTNACIAAGDTVYLTKNTVININDVAGVTVDNLTGLDLLTQNPLTVVEAVSYGVSEDNKTVDITIANRGVIAVNVAYVDVVALDINGYPIGKFITESDRLDAGEERVVSIPMNFIQGSTSTLRVIIDIDK